MRGLDGVARGDDVVPARGRGETELVEDVGTVDERADAGVPGHAVELVVVGARLDEALDEVVGEAVGVDVVADRGGEGAGVGELGGPRGAGLATSGVVPPAIEVTKRSWRRPTARIRR